VVRAKELHGHFSSREMGALSSTLLALKNYACLTGNGEGFIPGAVVLLVGISFVSSEAIKGAPSSVITSSRQLFL
jgi:hypothetical protein